MPSLIVRAGGHAEKRFLEFFAAQIRNRNTRAAYLRAVRDFLDWAEIEAGIDNLLDIEPVESPRVCRRPFVLSQAAMAAGSVWRS